ncbi:hypothetical protein TrRE_jg3513 [Triparma retinervis]|uniref:Uncharacterized protein n=1 Tax=Triparma retinervis TaxID=2557542 RepID=A0A9W7A9P7_9STRA|nr:hypothetical protein TrRE_jg3513 [Triparma retinervis]
MSLFSNLGAGGDIWSAGGFDFSSPLKDLLDRGNFTLQELLEEDELLQEVKSLNSQLITFLSTPNTLKELVVFLSDGRDDMGVVDSTMGGGDKEEGENEKDKDDNDRDTSMSGSMVIVGKDELEGSGSSGTQDNNENGDSNGVSNGASDGNSNGVSNGASTGPNAPSDPSSPSAPSNDPNDSTASSASTASSIHIPASATEKIRYPYMACEVICCDVVQIIDGIVDAGTEEGGEEGGEGEGEAKENPPTAQVNNVLLDILFSLLDQPAPLPARQAGYFEKVLTSLFRRRPSSLALYINAGGFPLFSKFLSHLSNYSIMTLVKRMMMPPPNQVDDDGETWQIDPNEAEISMTCDWGTSPSYPVEIIKRMKGESPTFCLNASELLAAIIQQLPLNNESLKAISGCQADQDTGGDCPIKTILEMAIPDILTTEDMTMGESRMTAALGLLEVVLLQLGGYGCVPPIDEKEEQEMGATLANTEPLLEVLKEKGTLKLCAEHLKSPICEGWKYKNQTGSVVSKLGTARLKAARAVEAMILLASPSIDQLIADSDVLDACLDMFFEFEWCSLLHQSVANLLVHIIEGGAKREPLQEKVINKSGLLTRLLECFKKNSNPAPEQIGRLGLMGHVIIISQAIVHACSDEDDDEMFGSGEAPNPSGDNNFKDVVERAKENEEWQSFVMSTLANETAIQSTPLGGFNSPTRQDNLSDEDFGLDAQDMDIAASMIASLNMAANGAGGGVKLGMGGLSFDSNTMRSLGLALNGLGIEQDGDDDEDEDEFRGVNGYVHGARDDEDDSDEEDGNKNYYDDIINSVNNNTKKGFGVGDEEDDMVEVLEDSSDEEEEGEGKVQNLFNPSFADFDSAGAGGSAAAEGEGGPVEAWGSSKQQQAAAFEADFGGVETIPRSGSMGEDTAVGTAAGGGGGGGGGGGEDKEGQKNSWADPFEEFKGSARSDFFG